MENNFSQLIQKNHYEERLRDTIENEANELAAFIDEMHTVIGSAAFDDNEGTNLKKL